MEKPQLKEIKKIVTPLLAAATILGPIGVASAQISKEQNDPTVQLPHEVNFSDFPFKTQPPSQDNNNGVEVGDWHARTLRVTPNLKVLVAGYPKGAQDDNGKDMTEVIAHLPKDQTSIYMAMDVFVPRKFNFNGGEWKLGGLGSEVFNSNDNQPSAKSASSNGWSSRFVVKPAPSGKSSDSGLIMYTYTFDHHNPAGYGVEDPIWNTKKEQVSLTLGRWTCLEQKVTLNTVTGKKVNADGQITAWINDKQVFHKSGYIMRVKAGQNPISQGRVETFSNNPSTQNQEIAFGNVRYSKNYIACDQNSLPDINKELAPQKH